MDTSVCEETEELLDSLATSRQSQAPEAIREMPPPTIPAPPIPSISPHTPILPEGMPAPDISVCSQNIEGRQQEGIKVRPESVPQTRALSKTLTTVAFSPASSPNFSRSGKTQNEQVLRS